MSHFEYQNQLIMCLAINHYKIIKHFELFERGNHENVRVMNAHRQKIFEFYSNKMLEKNNV